MSTQFLGPFSEHPVLHFLDPPSAVPTVGFSPHGRLHGSRTVQAQPAPVHPETRCPIPFYRFARHSLRLNSWSVAEVEKVFHGKQEVVQLAVAARRLVDLYLRARFGTHPLDVREQRTLTEALGNVRSHLRPA